MLLKAHEKATRKALQMAIVKSCFTMLTPTHRAIDRKKIAIPERMTDVAGTAQLVALWLHNKAATTQKNYEYDVRCFIAFLLGESPANTRLNDIDLRTVTLNDVQAFADFLENNPKLGSDIRRRRLLAVRSLLRFGHKKGFLNHFVADEVKLPDPKDTLAERIASELEVMTVVALTKNHRDKLLLQFLYYTGARVAETARLTWKDINPNRDRHGQVTLYGKGGKTRVVLIPKNLYNEVLKIKSGDAVFPSRNGGKPLSVRQIQAIVEEAGKRAGIDGFSPHWLRHAHASHALDRGAPIQLVQQTLGHSSLAVTTRYAHARPNDSSGLYLPR